jgi:hypothetical protein
MMSQEEKVEMNNEELILQTLMEMKQDIGEIKSKVSKVEPLEKRVSTLEGQNQKQIGAASVISVVSSFVFAILLKIFLH